MNPKINIDPNETAKFTKLAHEWWELSGPCKPLHIINSARLEFISKIVQLNAKQVLDVGCGGGILTESLVDQGAIVTGIDASQEVIEIAKEHALQHNKNIAYFALSSEEYAAANQEKFDIIVCMELLEHVPEPISLINSLADMLKPGGAVFFSTINRNLKSYLLGIIAAEYILKILPKKTHDYSKFITPAELAGWLRQTKLHLQQMAGISFNPFTDSARLTQDLSVNYIAHAKKI